MTKKKKPVDAPRRKPALCDVTDDARACDFTPPPPPREEAPRRHPAEWMKRKKIKDFIHAGAAKRAKWRGEPITEADYDQAVEGFLKHPPSGTK